MAKNKYIICLIYLVVITAKKLFKVSDVCHCPLVGYLELKLQFHRRSMAQPH
jgi:hypothetical protein